MSDNQSSEYIIPERQLTLEEMKQFLWGAATRLRGQIDATGYKEYIFPLLFFKRISDVYDEQFNGYVAEGGEEYANMQVEDFAIKIPDKAHWRDVRAVTENVGQRLVEAFIAIEQANPGIHTDGRVVGGLEGIFGPKDIWTNKNKMPDHIITSLIEDFSRYNLSLAACPADEMGQAYEYLVGKFADDAGNTAQEFYTNRTVVTLMAEILKPKPGESIYDPTCGSGGMLVKCLDYLREKGEAWQSVKVFGQEINALTSSIARMNLYLNGVEDFSIVREDTLKHPAFVDGSQLQTFDVVLANPPYSIKAWDRDAFANDKWGRNFLGTPPRGRADYAFLQHIIASLDEKTGRCAILFPHGVLFRKEEKEMREALIKSDKIEAVIGLGPNLFYNSPMEACIIICNNNKIPERKGKVLMINAIKEVVRKNAESFLLPEHISKILSAFKTGDLIDGFSALIENEEIIRKNSDLTISLYAYSSSIMPNQGSHNNPFDDWTRKETSLLNSVYELADLIGIEIPKTLPLNLFSPDRGNVMTVRLGDVAHEVKETWKGETIDVPVVGLEHLIPGDIVLSNWDLNPNENTFTKKFSAGQILLGRRRVYQKKASIAQLEGICSGDITTIAANIPNSEIGLYNNKDCVFINPNLLPFIIQNDRFFDYAVQGSAGSLSPRVKWDHLKNYEFSIPSSSDGQKRLADQLWAAYRLKEAYKRLLAATDEMVKSQFIEMFGSVDSFSTLQDLISDTFPGEWGNEPATSNAIKVIRTTNFTNEGRLDLSEVVTREIDSKKVSRKKLKKGDIILERSGGTKDNPVGRVVFFEEDGDYLYNNFTQVLRPNEGINPVYLFYSLYNSYNLNKAAMRAMASQTTGIQNLSMSDYMRKQICIPPKELQDKFESIYRQADKSKFELKKAIEAIDQVIKSLING